MDTINEIKRLLNEAFDVELMDVVDDSRKHATHAEAIASGGGHYFILLVSTEFEGKSLLIRHRKVYAALKSIKAKIHALGLKTYTPQEYASSGA